MGGRIQNPEARPRRGTGAYDMTLVILDTRGESDDVLNALRRRAIAALQAGYSGVVVAAILGVTAETVSRWWSMYRADGPVALTRRRCGRPVGSGRLPDDTQAQRVQQLI